MTRRIVAGLTLVAVLTVILYAGRTQAPVTAWAAPFPCTPTATTTATPTGSPTATATATPAGTLTPTATPTLITCGAAVGGVAEAPASDQLAAAAPAPGGTSALPYIGGGAAALLLLAAGLSGVWYIGRRNRA